MAKAADRPSDRSGLEMAGWRSKSVKDELRLNVIARLRESRPILPGIVGYEQTVTPQIVNAILSGHDFILLGLPAPWPGSSTTRSPPSRAARSVTIP